MIRHHQATGGWLLLVTLLAGCVSAQSKFVVFPTAGQDTVQVQKDRDECEAFAKENRNNDEALSRAGISMLGGATGGALLGAIVGAFSGTAGRSSALAAAVGAGVGLVGGFIGGLRDDWARYQRVYAMCMQLRGYALAG